MVKALREADSGTDSGMDNGFEVKVPFLVKVGISDLNIRSGGGTYTAKTGKYTGIGTFTITQVKSGKGLTLGWGELKFGVGWISLDYCICIS